MAATSTETRWTLVAGKHYRSDDGWTITSLRDGRWHIARPDGTSLDGARIKEPTLSVAMQRAAAKTR